MKKIDLVFNQRIDEVVRVVAEIRKEEDKVKIIEQRKESSTDTNEKDKLERELILSRKEIDILNSKLSELSNLQGNSILNNYDKNYSTKFSIPISEGKFHRSKRHKL